MSDDTPSPETPHYSKTRECHDGATPTFMVNVDEGWRISIVCTGMYEWAADWLVQTLQGKPYAPGHEAR